MPRVWRKTRADYIQSADNAAFLRLAGARKTVVRMEHGTGEFALQNTTLASVALEGPPDQETIAAVLATFSISSHRTVDRGAAFVDRQIADAALKALSPGNNDTTTARMRGVDYLTTIIARIAPRGIPSMKNTINPADITATKDT